jgi:hypothetical protein
VAFMLLSLICDSNGHSLVYFVTKDVVVFVDDDDDSNNLLDRQISHIITYACVWINCGCI